MTGKRIENRPRSPQRHHNITPTLSLHPSTRTRPDITQQDDFCIRTHPRLPLLYSRDSRESTSEVAAPALAYRPISC